MYSFFFLLNTGKSVYKNVFPIFISLIKDVKLYPSISLDKLHQFLVDMYVELFKYIFKIDKIVLITNFFLKNIWVGNNANIHVGNVNCFCHSLVTLLLNLIYENKITEKFVKRQGKVLWIVSENFLN